MHSKDLQKSFLGFIEIIDLKLLLGVWIRISLFNLSIFILSFVKNDFLKCDKSLGAIRLILWDTFYYFLKKYYVFQK